MRTSQCGNLGLVDVVQLQGLGQGEDVLLAVVAGQGGAERLQRRVAARVAIGGQNVRDRVPRRRWRG